MNQALKTAVRDIVLQGCVSCFSVGSCSLEGATSLHVQGRPTRFQNADWIWKDDFYALCSRHELLVRSSDSNLLLNSERSCLAWFVV